MKPPLTRWTHLPILLALSTACGGRSKQTQGDANAGSAGTPAATDAGNPDDASADACADCDGGSCFYGVCCNSDRAGQIGGQPCSMEGEECGPGGCGTGCICTQYEGKLTWICGPGLCVL